MRFSGTATLDPAPPRTPPGGDGHGGGWAWLMTATGIVEAQLVQGVLDQTGIPVALDGRDQSPFAWMYLGGNVNAPVRVLVPGAVLQAARLALLEAGFAMDAPDWRPSAEQAPRSRIVFKRIILVAAALVILWIVAWTWLGSATCALRLVC